MTGITKKQLAEKVKKNKILSDITIACIIILIATIVIVNIFTNILQIVSYNGDAMEPTLTNGQTLIVSRISEIEDNDIVAFYYNNKILVRRVICSGGSQINITNDGSVFVNGTAITEDYIGTKSKGQCNTSFPVTVEENHYFVMGDNRENSMDSRLTEIGTVFSDRIIGKVIIAF